MRNESIAFPWKAPGNTLQRGSLLALAVASTLAMAGAVQAAEAPGASVLEEIIVTAERRASTEQATSISMNVLSPEALAESRTQNFADLQNSTPNVTINQAGTFNVINIRGIGNSAITPAITTGVAVFQDGLLNAETITLGGSFLDPASIEILRGPQGTFVGASSTGGAIRVNSVLPNFDGINGYAEALIGTKSDKKLTGAVNLPISETWAARLAFNNETRDSYFHAVNLIAAPNSNPMKRPGSLDEKNMRATLLWRPNDAFEAIFRAESNNTDHGGSPFQPNPRTFTNTLGVQTRSRYYQYDDPGHDPEKISISRYDAQDVTIVERYSADLKYTFGNGIQVRSLTGFVHNENRIMEDDDGSSANGQVTRNNVGPDNNYYSQEFNLISPEGPLNWIVGASWFYRHTPPNLVQEIYNVPNLETADPTDVTTCGYSPATGFFNACAPTFANGVPSLTFINFSSTARSLGAFGQLNWKFTDALEVTLGVRMNYDRNFIRQANGIIPVIPAPVGAAPPFVTCPANIQGTNQLAQFNASGTPYSCILGIGVSGEQEDDVPTWKLGLNWTPADNQLIYAFWSRGYKSGGIDAGGVFDEEKVDDYELGWKGQLADGRIQMSVGGYWMEYENYQQAAFRATTIRAATVPYNIGSATMKGLEAELNAKFGGLGINANVGYLDSSLGSIRLIDRLSVPDSSVRIPGTNQDAPQCATGQTAGCVDWTPFYRNLSGLPNVYSPELSYSATLSYDIASGDATWTPRVNYTHMDKQFTDLLRREDFYTIPERDLVNVSLTYTVNDWLVQAYCNNCADKTYIAAMQGTSGDNVLYGAPLTYGLRVRRSF